MKDAFTLAKQYPVTVEPAIEDGIAFYYAYSDKFPGIRGDGDTTDEAIQDFREVLADVIQDRLDEGIALPEVHPPSPAYSGKLSLRLPKSAHQMVARQSENDGISINQWIINAIMYYLGAGRRIAEQPQTINITMNRYESSSIPQQRRWGATHKAASPSEPVLYEGRTIPYVANC